MHTVGNYDELEIYVQFQGYDLIKTTEKWWDGCVTGELQWTDAGSLGRADQEDDERVLREQLECMEFCLGMDSEFG